MEVANMWWDIFDEMEQMHREMDRQFAHMFLGRPLLENRSKELATGIRPAKCDVAETESSVVASFELPGANKNEIELNVTDEYVEVKVEKRVEEHEDKGAYRYASASSQFYRMLPFPLAVKADQAKATYKNGLLRIEIPKAIEHKGKRKIEIE
ncbi:MAG: Hsp20/alpha crystallin family protein [Candidatus Woesearchaeota archaeon]